MLLCIVLVTMKDMELTHTINCCWKFPASSELDECSHTSEMLETERERDLKWVFKSNINRNCFCKYRNGSDSVSSCIVSVCVCLYIQIEREVCPVCSVKVESDILSHITMRHGNLFKFQRRRRFRRVAVPDSQTLSPLGRDLREAHLQVLLGGGAYRSSSSTPSAASTDPLLSSFIINNPASEAEEFSKAVTLSTEDLSMENKTSQNLWKSSFDPSLSVEERQKQMRQAARKTVFMQDLVVSALLVE